jgi:deoxyribodipyrimidine photo-lyase
MRSHRPGTTSRPADVDGDHRPVGVIHQPWNVAPLELAGAGVRRGKTYPAPIIDHKDGRERALAAHARVRNA